MNKCYTSGHVWFMYLLLVIAFFLSINSYAQQQLFVAKITEEINFDLIPDEPFWQSIEGLPLVNFFTPKTQDTLSCNISASFCNIV